MIDQVAEASRQLNWEATELLVATVLEAALRTLQNVPFVPGAKNSWKADKSLAAFCTRYLGRGWEEQSRSVLAAWRRLRHKNAHPTWLTDSRRDEAAAGSALADMALLTRFYGTMIFAMAGRPVSLPLAVPKF